jgi:hypothetical protein
VAVTRSEGGGVEVNSGSVTMTNNLRKRTVVASFEAGVEAAACSGAGDEAAALSRAGIEDGKWQWWHNGFLGDSRARERERERGQNFAKCDERERGPEILVRGT